MNFEILDLFCGAGGAAKGYQDAGFYVVGVDIIPQPNYIGDEFVQADALEWLNEGLPSGNFFSAIHASPPCQAYSNAQRIQDNDHPDLIGPTRELLKKTGLPYVIENVPGAPLIDPVELCGTCFGLRTYRHRLFETNWPLDPPIHPNHEVRNTKMGRPPKDDEFMHVVGNFSGVTEARKVMGIDWMTRDELSEAIPPAYTRFVGTRLIAEIQQ